VIDIRRDYAGLRIAAAQMYVESFLQKEVDTLMRDATPEAAAEAKAKIVPARTVSVGYFHWVSYLLWLKSILALPGNGLQLYADEAEGLMMLADAEHEFRRQHPSCPRCGSLNESFAGACRECFAEL